jgi:hypothetical protein
MPLLVRYLAVVIRRAVNGSCGTSGKKETAGEGTRAVCECRLAHVECAAISLGT